MLTVDARGLDCPKPVIQTKNALDHMDKGVVETIVDNDVARENVLKLAGSMNYEAIVTEISSGYSIKIIKEVSLDAIDVGYDHEVDNLVYFIDSNTIGRGNDELGGVLMKSFFYTILQRHNGPKSVIFVNSGVFLVCENSPILEHLDVLAKEGTVIMACGTCLDYYGLKDKIKVGTISNMYDIVETLNCGARVINI